jgi:hypothetical protein
MTNESNDNDIIPAIPEVRGAAEFFATTGVVPLGVCAGPTFRPVTGAGTAKVPV